MSEGGTTSANVAAIVEALDKRAKEAGADGAARMLQPALDPVHESLGSIEDRLARLEAAFVRALEASVAAPDPVAPAALDLSPLTARLDRLEELIAALGTTPADVDIPAWVAALDAAMPAPADAPPAGTVDLTPVIDRLERIEHAMSRPTSTPAPAPPSPVLAPVDLTPLVERLEALEAEVAGARVVQLVEERMGAGLSAIIRRIESASDQEVRPPAAVERDVEVDLEPLVAAIREQFELLTQRVAALHVGVEATRALLDQHVQDTANSLGRKATDVGRRIAADFGFRTKRPESTRTREIGPGA